MNVNTPPTPLAVSMPATLLFIVTLVFSVIAASAVGVGMQSYLAGGFAFIVTEGVCAFLIDTLVLSYLGTGIIGGVKLWLRS